MLSRSLPVVLLLVTSTLGMAPSGPWDDFNIAPASKTLYPAFVHGTSGSVSNKYGLLTNESTTLDTNGSYITLDFGLEVGGLISLNFDNVSTDSSLALAFTESPVFIRSYASDDSSYPSANTTYDGVLDVNALDASETGYWTQPSYRLRGGFRYLTISSTSSSAVTISNVSLAIAFMPHWETLRNYSGYFYSWDPNYFDGDLLTKVWYSGAYTVQTDTVAVDSGRMYPFVTSPGWENNGTLGVAGPIIVDGAKRDRCVWPGDMGIAVPTQFVSTFDLLSTRNALSTMFSTMDAETGQLKESGPPLNQPDSDTYSCWTLIGTYNYYLYSGDNDWLEDTWANYTKAVAYMMGKVTDIGLLNVTGLRDWGRLGQGGYNAEANAIFYKVLTNSAELAGYLNDTDLSAAYTANATTLKEHYNAAFWIEDLGMYRDNLTTMLTPQDANSFAVLFNLTNSTAQAQSISEGLTRNWVDFGSVAPELPETIAPFIGGFELQAHFVTGNNERALELLRREWGYMLYTPLSVQSTMLEGYTSNGSLYYRSTDGYYYDPAYISHSHGWSTGPTSALTFYVLGLTVTSPQGQTWSVAPHTSGLPYAQGGYETPLGWYGVEWVSGTDSFNITISTPEGTSGSVTLPVNGTVVVNGSEADTDGTTPLALEGGNHTIYVTSSS